MLINAWMEKSASVSPQIAKKTCIGNFSILCPILTLVAVASTYLIVLGLDTVRWGSNQFHEYIICCTIPRRYSLFPPAVNYILNNT